MLRIASVDVPVIFPDCTTIFPAVVASPNIRPVIDGDVVDVEPAVPIVTVPVVKYTPSPLVDAIVPPVIVVVPILLFTALARPVVFAFVFVIVPPVICIVPPTTSVVVTV